MPEKLRLLLSCEHGGNAVPPAYTDLFRGQEALLASHRGWDPGALYLAERLASTLDAPLIRATVTRLLVELNRSPGHPQLFSEVSRPLSAALRERILEEYYRPYRRQVENEINSMLEAGNHVVHLSVHSFTPVFEGQVRNVDLGLLYDPSRSREKAFCCRWQQLLQNLDPALRVRRNRPYRGTADGLVTLLRHRLPPDRYLGLELEANQKYVASDDFEQIATVVAATLSRLLGER